MTRAMHCLAGVLLVSGCHSIGPTTVPRDHFDYNAAISNAWKEEMLLNMVRLRYGEAPVFLDVASVIAQYSLEGHAQVNAPGYDRPNNVGPPIASGALRWSDRPTITYQPRTGQQLARTLLTPLPIGSVFALIQAGWPLDAILGSTLRTVNGLPARTGVAGRWNAPFLAAIDAVSRVVELGAGSVRQAENGMVFVIHDDLAADARDAVSNLRAALDLDPAASEYAIVSSPFAETRQQIALATASVIDILNRFSARFEVPVDHVNRGWTFASPPVGGVGAHWSDERAIHVRSGANRPEQAFVATFERGAWFWIDESDYRSKRTFSFLLMLMNLAEVGSGATPVVTIGAGGS